MNDSQIKLHYVINNEDITLSKSSNTTLREATMEVLTKYFSKLKKDNIKNKLYDLDFSNVKNEKLLCLNELYILNKKISYLELDCTVDKIISKYGSNIILVKYNFNINSSDKEERRLKDIKDGKETRDNQDYYKININYDKNKNDLERITFNNNGINNNNKRDSISYIPTKDNQSIISMQYNNNSNNNNINKYLNILSPSNASNTAKNLSVNNKTNLTYNTNITNTVDTCNTQKQSYIRKVKSQVSIKDFSSRVEVYTIIDEFLTSIGKENSYVSDNDSNLISLTFNDTDTGYAIFSYLNNLKMEESSSLKKLSIQIKILDYGNYLINSNSNNSNEINDYNSVYKNNTRNLKPIVHSPHKKGKFDLNRTDIRSKNEFENFKKKALNSMGEQTLSNMAYINNNVSNNINSNSNKGNLSFNNSILLSNNKILDNLMTHNTNSMMNGNNNVKVSNLSDNDIKGNSMYKKINNNNIGREYLNGGINTNNASSSILINGKKFISPSTRKMKVFALSSVNANEYKKIMNDLKEHQHININKAISKVWNDKLAVNAQSSKNIISSLQKDKLWKDKKEYSLGVRQKKLDSYEPVRNKLYLNYY